MNISPLTNLRYSSPFQGSIYRWKNPEKRGVSSVYPAAQYSIIIIIIIMMGKVTISRMELYNPADKTLLNFSFLPYVQHRIIHLGIIRAFFCSGRYGDQEGLSIDSLLAGGGVKLYRI